MFHKTLIQKKLRQLVCEGHEIKILYFFKFLRIRLICFCRLILRFADLLLILIVASRHLRLMRSYGYVRRTVSAQHSLKWWFYGDDCDPHTGCGLATLPRMRFIYYNSIHNYIYNMGDTLLQFHEVRSSRTPFDILNDKSLKPKGAIGRSTCAECLISSDKFVYDHRLRWALKC